MAILDGSTRTKIAELAVLIGNWEMERADASFREIVHTLRDEALTLASPELRELVKGFHKTRQRKLSELLERTLAGGSLEEEVSPLILATPESARQRGDRYAAGLDGLRDKHIFQWVNHYRPYIRYIFRDMIEQLRDRATWDDEIIELELVFAEHSQDIFERGFSFTTEKGFQFDVAIAKSAGGLQRFVYLIMSLLVEETGLIRGAPAARLAWDVVSSMISGVLRGYGRSDFGTKSGWVVLLGCTRVWLPALGFVRGGQARDFLEEFPQEVMPKDIYVTIVPLLLAMEKLANRYHGSDFVCPRFSRVTIGYPPRLDVSLVIEEGVVIRDLMVSSFFEGQIESMRPVEDAISLRAAVVVALIPEEIHDSSGSESADRLLNAINVQALRGEVDDFSEAVSTRLEAQARAGAEALESATYARNFAAEFPLEDPDFRQLFTIERYSVKSLLDNVRRGTGIHLWCSVRRSGKTTAAISLAGVSDNAQVVFQTMDHQPTQIEQNLLEERVRGALTSGLPIAGDFFQRIVDDCLLMGSASNGFGKRKVVLVIDEYESLFGLLAAMTSRDPGLRFTVAQPLLSQMVGFASSNLLILMGQRPDAHFILSSQNQFSPLVKQHNFPLFEHVPGSGSSEFAQFLKRVLSDKLSFDSKFANAVYAETRGHPYLTVNLMVDLCDWLIQTGVKQTDSDLSGETFKAFERERLTAAALQRSPHYGFFVNMLSEYLSEQGRIHEPWLYSVTGVLKELGRKRSATLVSGFQKLAAPFCTDVNVTPEQLLVSASMSNFVRISDGQVLAGIPLMVRLATVAIPRAN